MDVQGTLNRVSSGVTGLQKGFNNAFKQPTQVMKFLPDMSSVLGPVYDYSGELKSPDELDIRMGDGSLDGIGRAAAGVDYYAGALGYGKSVGLSKNEPTMSKQHPLGLNFFLKTGATCSNGANMYEYVSTVPVGIPGELGDKLAKEMNGIRLQGLAPGIINDAGNALNPAPFFNAVIGSGFAKCKQETQPVGDYEGKLKSERVQGQRPWIDTSVEKVVMKTENGEKKPHATHWVFDKWVSADEYNKEKKSIVEGFQTIGGSPVAAGVLFTALFLGLVVFTMERK